MIKKHIVYNNFNPWKFDVSRAEGSYLFDQNDKRYIDFTSGWNVTNLGWNNPEVNEAVAKQATKNTYVPMWTADQMQEEYAEHLTAALPKELDAVIRGTGGTEAVEMSIKIARSATGRKKIIGFGDTYHGQLFAAMALGWRPPSVTEIAPLVPEFVQIEYPTAYKTNKTEEQVLSDFFTNLEELLSKKDIAAIVTEAGIITGWGSLYVTPSGYLSKLREITKKYGTLLILDEVGTGFSRTGKLFGLEHENIVPDMVVLAKGIANGSGVISVVVTSSELVEPTVPGTNLTSTFGYTPLACAAANKTLEIHQRDKVWEQAETKGTYMISKLRETLKDHPHVGDVRGKGLEIGIDFVQDKTTLKENSELFNKVIEASFAKGLHLVGDGTSVLQLMPPLTTPQEVLEEGLKTLIAAIQNN